jgi:hypothetical protein
LAASVACLAKMNHVRASLIVQQIVQLPLCQKLELPVRLLELGHLKRLDVLNAGLIVELARFFCRITRVSFYKTICKIAYN